MAFPEWQANAQRVRLSREFQKNHDSGFLDVAAYSSKDDTFTRILDYGSVL